jgi:hypothetical protein
MKYRKKHTRNGVTHEAGDPYDGPIHSGRFLYHRGVLEPDGSPDDALITSPKQIRSAWDVDTAAAPVNTRDSTVAEVLQRVDTGSVTALAALNAERAGRNRVTLIQALEERALASWSAGTDT